MMFSKSRLSLTAGGAIIRLTIFFSVWLIPFARARDHHVINFKSPNLFPESMRWDPKGQHFVLSSLRHPTIVTVSDAGVVHTLISDISLPTNSILLGVAIDTSGNRVLATVHVPATESSPVFNALVGYDLSSRKRLFLTQLSSATDDEESNSSDVANDVAVDFSGNAYVTNSGADMIWKVDGEGKASILSRSNVFKSHPVDRTAWYHYCGLNGIVYNSKGYLLVVQSNTGKLYKVDPDEGRARTVKLNKDLTAGDGMGQRRDGVVTVVSQQKLYYLKSTDGWEEGIVFDETTLDAEGQASAVAIGEDNRVYVLYGHVNEGMKVNTERDLFSIVQVESDLDKPEDFGWMFGLIGLGVIYFLIWKFQMSKLFQNLNKKRE